MILTSPTTTCGDPHPVCLVGDPIKAGGEPRTVVVRAICALTDEAQAVAEARGDRRCAGGGRAGEAR